MQHCPGQRPFCSKKHKKPTGIRDGTSAGGGRGGYFSTSNQKYCDTDIPASHVKPEPQKIKCEPPGWPASDRRTQTSRFLSSRTVPSLEQELSITPRSYCTKPKHDQSGKRSLWVIATQIVCNNDYYFWNIVKTSIGAPKVFTSNVRKIYAVISLPESEQQQCPD